MHKILVAEDDKFLSNAYRIKFGKEGFMIKIAADGLEVLEDLDTFKPDLLVLDLVMPRMDGFAVLTKIKKDKKFDQLPIIIASNLGQTEDLQKAIELGANDYVIKNDLSMSDLLVKIRSLLK